MTPRLTELTEKKLADRLQYYEDIGLGLFYRNRGSSWEASVQAGTKPMDVPERISPIEEPQLPKRIVTQAVPPVAAVVAPARSKPIIASAEPSLFEVIDKIENDSLPLIREHLGDCTRCKLHKTRNKLVFGDGNPNAELVFVGEGPGADEDEQGLPFVGRAGKLLTQMIEAMGLKRSDVYICNVVKCRPPQNRQPELDEVKECSPFLFRQIDTIAPKVIVCLGATAAKTILNTDRGISQFRGEWQTFRGRKLLATYHPAYLLRNPAAKSEVWKDLQKVMAELGLAVKRGKSA